MILRPALDRRAFLASASTAWATSRLLAVQTPTPALIAITLDLEMARNFPRWEDTEWDYQKGNLDANTKSYARAVSDFVREQGGVVHHFAVGQSLEQADIAWLVDIARHHPVGNHTYDHVNLLARDLPSLQFRFQRAPWLARGKPVAALIEENVTLMSEALRTRLGIEPAGFRTPGGFADGLAGREDLQNMLRNAGFTWVSSKYPAHAGIEDLHGTGRSVSAEALDAILASQSAAQPFRYPTGLIEVPMSPPSDIVAFRGGRWSLDQFLNVIARVLDHVIERGLAYDFLAHPSCLGVVDPELKSVRLICRKVHEAGDRAKLVALDAIAGKVT